MFQHADFSTVSPGRYVWQCTLAMALQIFSNPLKSLQPSGHSFFQVTGHTIVSQLYQAAAVLWLASWHSRDDLYCLCPWPFHEETQEAKITFFNTEHGTPFLWTTPGLIMASLSAMLTGQTCFLGYISGRRKGHWWENLTHWIRRVGKMLNGWELLWPQIYSTVD